jgi:hypothetical protein
MFVEEASSLAPAAVAAASALLGALVGSLVPAIQASLSHQRKKHDRARDRLQQLWGQYLMATRQLHKAFWDMEHNGLTAADAQYDKHSLRSLFLLDSLEIMDRDRFSVVLANEMYKAARIAPNDQPDHPFLVSRRKLLERLTARFGVAV